MRAHGLLLTGGRSSRMRTDKALIELGGAAIAARAARALATVARPAFAVGREAGTGLEAIPDGGAGPLHAFVAGARALTARGNGGPILLVACDLPFVTARLLAHLTRILEEGGADAAVPVAGGRDQPLAGCYSPAAAAVAERLVADGRDAMRDLLASVRVSRLDGDALDQVAPPETLLDVDTPSDLDAARRILDSPA